MDICSESYWFIRFRDKNFSVGHNTQNVQLMIFIPAMLIGTIDVNHFVTFSLTLTLPGGHKVIAKQNLLASFSHIFFI